MPAPSKISVLHKWSAHLPGERSHTLFAQREHNFLTNSQSKWFLVWGILGAAGGCEIPERTFSNSSGAGPGVSAPQLHTPPHFPTPTQDRTSRTMSAQTLLGVHRVKAETHFAKVPVKSAAFSEESTKSEVGAQPRPRALPGQPGPEGREATPTCASQSLHFLSSVL